MLRDRFWTCARERDRERERGLRYGDWRRRRSRDSAEMDFEVYGKKIQSVPRFKYLGRILTEGDDDWPAVAGHLAKSRKR